MDSDQVKPAHAVLRQPALAQPNEAGHHCTCYQDVPVVRAACFQEFYYHQERKEN